MIVLILTAVAFSGCFGGQDAPGLGRAGPLKAFEAVHLHEESGTEWVLEFGAPVTVMDRDEVRRSAYTLRSFPKAEEGLPAERVYYLDRELQVVRVDRVCHMQWETEACTHYRVSFSEQGSPPRWGAFWPRLLDETGLLRYSTWMTELAVRPIVEIGDNGTFTLSLGQDEVLAPARGALSLLGNYTYGREAEVPTSFTQRYADGASNSYRLLSYREGNQLPEPEAWPKDTGVPPSRERSARVFPGEGEDVFGSGSSPRDALDWLVENDATAQTMIATGCVQMQRYDPPFPWPDATPPIHAELLGQPYRHSIRILNPEDGKGWVWDILYTRSILGGSHEIDRKERWVQPGGFACRGLSESPSPALSMTEFVEKTDDWPVSAQGRGNIVYAAGGLGSPEGGWYVVHHPEQGMDHYSRQYVPAHADTSQGSAAYMPYAIGYLASVGWFTQVLLHPDDIRTLDSRQP